MKKQLLLGSIVGVMLLSNFSYAENDVKRIACANTGAYFGNMLNSCLVPST